MDKFAPKRSRAGLHGRTTAGCLDGDSCVGIHLTYLVSYYLRWQLYSAVPQFPVFWPSEMTSATFCESSPTVQSRVQSTEYRRPACSRVLLHEIIVVVCNSSKQICMVSTYQHSPPSPVVQLHSGVQWNPTEPQLTGCSDYPALKIAYSN